MAKTAEKPAENKTENAPEAKGKKGRKARAFRFFDKSVSENVGNGLKIAELSHTLKAATYKNVEGKKVTKDADGAVLDTPAETVTTQAILIDPDSVGKDGKSAGGINEFLKRFDRDGFNPRRFVINAVNTAIEKSQLQAVKRPKDALNPSDALLLIPSIKAVSEPDPVKLLQNTLGQRKAEGQTEISADEAQKLMAEMMAKMGFTIKQK
jgi:hypothetical protein